MVQRAKCGLRSWTPSRPCPSTALMRAGERQTVTLPSEDDVCLMTVWFSKGTFCGCSPISGPWSWCTRGQVCRVGFPCIASWRRRLFLPMVRIILPMRASVRVVSPGSWTSAPVDTVSLWSSHTHCCQTLIYYCQTCWCFLTLSYLELVNMLFILVLKPNFFFLPFFVLFIFFLICFFYPFFLLAFLFLFWHFCFNFTTFFSLLYLSLFFNHFSLFSFSFLFLPSFILFSCFLHFC